jgi:putative salt-induced outer membrane protein
MNRVVCAGVLFAVAAGTLGAQEAKKPPYEFVSDFSLAASQGNQEVTTVSLGQRYSYVFPNWKFSQTASAVRGTANGVRNAELYQAALRLDRVLTKPWSLYVTTTALRNTPAGLTSQFSEAIGLGYQFLDTDIDKFSLSAGVGALQRAFVGTTPGTRDFVGNVDGMYRHMFSKVSYFEQTAGLIPNFTTTNAWQFTSKSAIVAPLSSRIGIKVAYLINYNNAPPLNPTTVTNLTDRFKKFDGLLTTGMQFTY